VPGRGERVPALVGSLDDERWRSLIGLDAAYTYFPTYVQTLKEYNRAKIPVFMMEAQIRGVGREPLHLHCARYWRETCSAINKSQGRG
jgi:hypothetical protein